MCVNRICYATLESHYALSGVERADQAARWLRPLWRYATPETHPRLLELGSADGVLTGRLADQGFEVTAVDFSPGMCRQTRRSAPSATVVCGDYMSADLPAAGYEVIFAMAIVHLTPPPWDVEAMSRVRRLLAPNGVAFVSTTVEAQYTTGYEVKEGQSVSRYRTRYTREAFDLVIQQADLQVAHFYETSDRLAPGKVWGNWIVKIGGAR